MERQKGHFRLKAKWGIPTNITMYECAECAADGVDHEIKEESGPPAKGNEYSFKGDPTTIRVCTGCDKYDGPWVPAPY